MLLSAQVEDARAQWTPKWLNVGDFQSRYLSGGAVPETDEAAWSYPGIRPRSAYIRWKGFWVSAKNVKDETGKVWPIRTSHVGPRFIGIGEVFDISQRLISRYPQPTVTVDGAPTFSEPVIVDEHQASLKPDRMVVDVINTSIGVTMERKAMAWSHPEHDNYHIIEYTFTNTGNVDDDEAVEQTGALEDVYFTFIDRSTGAGVMAGGWDNNAGGVAWGQYTMNDAVGDGVSDYGVDLRAQFTWLGNIKKAGNLPLNTLGAPMWRNHERNPIRDDTLGRLSSANFSGVVTVHADQAAHAAGAASADDPAQPRTMTYLNSDYGDITSGSSHSDEAKMALERRWIECGSTQAVNGGVQPGRAGEPCTAPARTWPTHARIIQGQTDASTPHDSDPDFANQIEDPTRGAGAGGWGFMSAYGPYDMAQGQQVKIVVAEAVAGLADSAQWKIGREYKLSNWNDATIHEYDADGDGSIDANERMTKNEWVMTARDSLFKVFQRAIDNYRGDLSAPHPPPPPTAFAVTSGTDKITLTWTAAGSPARWEIWRAQKHYSGIITALSVGSDGLAVPDWARTYQCIAGCPGKPAITGTTYEDESVEPSGSYYYYLQAVGADGQKSSRYYTQTYQPATLRLAPGTSLDEVRIVPNPYHRSADSGLRADVADRIVFYGLPARGTIQIFTELGELVRTIEHTNESGDENWDMTTSSGQLLVSGIYIAVVTNSETGDKVIRKFIIIR